MVLVVQVQIEGVQDCKNKRMMPKLCSKMMSKFCFKTRSKLCFRMKDLQDGGEWWKGGSGSRRVFISEHRYRYVTPQDYLHLLVLHQTPLHQHPKTSPIPASASLIVLFA